MSIADPLLAVLLRRAGAECLRAKLPVFFPMLFNEPLAVLATALKLDLLITPTPATKLTVPIIKAVFISLLAFSGSLGMLR
ncbi:hypothetical protein, partial [Pseudomonas coronafaciens]|uniref:hypothetical protein n=1 Tax=Pseudomonas coronafaciens TaxID=53409 RepID=UPI001C7F288B